MNQRECTRFAPAPTGRLHLGHVVNALYVWGLARRMGAAVLLRIEDHDAQRSRPIFEAALLDDLDWLGFVPDRYPTAAFRVGPCESRQSDRYPLYATVAAELEARGLLYGCACTRQDIAARQAATTGRHQGYQGTCRSRGLPLSDALTWRVRVEPGAEPFVDLLQGPTQQDAVGGQGDPAIRDRHGNWTYTFAVVVDDLDQGVDLVIRGDDLRDATAGQVRLARMIGRARPAAFAHHPVLMKSPTRKLSKADGDTGISDLRREGWTAARLIGHAAAQAGLVAVGTELGAAEARELFTDVQFASG
jgi:glutamyl-tRNA synthetase/glutamyl-Q tRNA(Asp) synthetase